MIQSVLLVEVIALAILGFTLARHQLFAAFARWAGALMCLAPRRGSPTLDSIPVCHMSPVGEGTVTLLNRDGSSCIAAWEAESRADCGCLIRFRIFGESLIGAGSNFFLALKEARQKLETHELIPNCYGASRRAILTGMAADMGLGWIIYHAEPSEPGWPTKTVHLMATGPDVDPATLLEQEEFTRRFWEAIKSQSASSMVRQITTSSRDLDARLPQWLSHRNPGC